MNDTPKENWEEEFDKRYADNYMYSLSIDPRYYSIRKFIRDLLSSTEQRVVRKERERLLEQLFAIEQEKWKDAEHCTCLGYALVQLSGEEDSEERKQMEERLSQSGEDTIN